MKQIDKIKTHFRENKKTYLVGTGGVVVGAAGIILVGRQVNFSVGNAGFINWRTSANTIQVNMARPGPKSFVIQSAETQQTWPSLRAAAKDLGLNPGEVSKHLKGESSNIKGHHLTKLAEI